MKNITLLSIAFIVVACFSHTPEVKAQSTRYDSEKYHYFFDVPKDWSKIDQSELEKIEAMAGGESVVNFEVGFIEPGGRRDVKIQILDASNISAKSYVKQIEKMMPGVKSRIDQQRNIAYWYMQLPNDRKGLFAVIPGEYWVVQVNYYYPSESDDISPFTSIVDSFQYKDGYAYNRKKQTFWGEFLGSVLAATIFGAYFGGDYIWKKEKKTSKDTP